MTLTAILAGLFLISVMFGIHQGFVPVYFALMDAQGFNSLFPILALAGAGQVGAALAQQYARQGAQLGLLARRGDTLQQLIATLPHPERHRAYAVDVCDHAALKSAAQDFIAHAGRIDVVIASAGVS